MPPKIKIILYIVFIVSLIFIKNLFAYLVIVFLISMLLLRIPLPSLIRGWIPISIFLGLTFFSNLLFQYGRILFQAGPLFITEEGLALASLRTIRIFCMIAGAKILTATTGVEPLVNALGGLLKPFERVGVPVGEFFSTMGITMESLPRLKEQVVREYRTTLKDRKIEGLRNRARAISTFLLPLFIKSIQSPETFLKEELKSEIPVEHHKGGNGYEL